MCAPLLEFLDLSEYGLASKEGWLHLLATKRGPLCLSHETLAH
jgi:hypothetical protein